MSYCGRKISKLGMLVLPAVVLLSGCGLDITTEDGGAGAQPQGASEPTFAIAGAAMKGVIKQGLVTANRLVSDKDGYFTPHRLAAKPTLTSDDGSYQFQLRGKADGWALVELTADTGTRMVCDVVPQCEQPSSGPVAFGQAMPLDSAFSLRGAGDLITETVHLTPLTHLAVTLAERSSDGLSPRALADAYQTVEGWFGLAAGSMRLAPPDLTRLDDLGSVTADALQVAIANAAFLALVNDNAQWNTISEVLIDVVNQTRETGQISLIGDGTNVALADLIATAAIQASALQATVYSSIISQKLVVVEYSNVQHFKTIADVYDETDTIVADMDGTANDTSGDTTTDTSSDNIQDSIADTTGSDTTTGDDSTTDTVADTGTGTDTSEPPASEITPEEILVSNTALLSWTAPLTRENGESLAMGEIAGFEVVYGTSADSLDQSLAIGDASVDQLLVDELSTGSWYFAIRTLDTDGNRSRLSEVVHKQM